MGLVSQTLDRIALALNVPYPWVAAAASAVAGVLLAWAIHRVIRHVLLPLARRTRMDADDVFLRAIATPVALTTAFLGFLAAARLLWPEPVHAHDFARALLTGVLVIWAFALARVIGVLVLRASRHVGGERARGANLVARVGKVVIFVILLLTLLGVWGVSLTPLVASAGIAGIALALAAQDTLANFFAGMAVVFDKIYQVGDFVVLDPGASSELRGEVKDIGLRSTKILTRDDVLVVVPNSVIANGRVVNETGGLMQYRLRVPVDVAYESDLPHVEEVLLHVADGHPLVLPDPEPRVRFRTFGESGIRVDVLCWIADPKDRGPVVHELMKRTHAAFAQHGIRIPFPQRDVHVDPRKGEGRSERSSSHDRRV